MKKQVVLDESEYEELLRKCEACQATVPWSEWNNAQNEIGMYKTLFEGAKKDREALRAELEQTNRDLKAGEESADARIAQLEQQLLIESRFNSEIKSRFQAVLPQCELVDDVFDWITRAKLYMRDGKNLLESGTKD